MKKLLYFTLCLVICTVVKSNVDIHPQPPITSTSTTPKSVITTTTITTTTAKPTTTIPVTTTAAPNTTTVAPNTTTPAPSTTTKTTTTTTTPTTSTTKTPITTVAPITTTTPKPGKEVGLWTLNSTINNSTCIIMQMALQLRIPYEKTDNKSSNATVCVPKTAVATGDCGDGKTTQNITLTWKPDNSQIQDSVTFCFARNDSSKQFMLTSVTTVLTPDNTNFPNATSNATISAVLLKNEFITPLSMSYRCKKEETLKLSLKDAKNVTANFIVSDLHMQAFHEAAGKDFSTAEDCESNETGGIVPIAVGCSLAALILIVLIAFLIGRRRSQARGYLSM